MDICGALEQFKEIKPINHADKLEIHFCSVEKTADVQILYKIRVIFLGGVG